MIKPYLVEAVTRRFDFECINSSCNRRTAAAATHCKLSAKIHTSNPYA